MKVHYFYLSQGVTRGPLSKEEVEQLIHVRQLHAMDLVLKETSKGIEDWTALQEMNEFKDAFKNVVKQEDPLDWVVLVRRGKGQYLQNGPFSTKDIQNHLRDGRLRFVDYVWKVGMTEWVKISDVAEFKTKKKTPKIDKIDPIERSEKTLPEIPKISYAKQNTTEFSNNPFRADEGKEIRLIEIDLDPLEPEEVKPPEEIEKKTEPATDQKQEKDFIRPFIFEAKKKNQWMMLVSAALLSFLVAILYQVNKRPESNTKIVTEKAPEKELKQEPKVVAKEATEDAIEVTQPKQEVIKEERKEPRQISFLLDGDQLEVQSDGSTHYPLRLVLVGLPGQLQEGRLWFRAMLLRPKNGSTRISLSEMNIVPGIYRIRLSTETGLKVERELSYGTSHPDYISLRNKNRKEQSYWYQLDRARLINRVAKLREAMKGNVKSLKEKDKTTDKVFFFEWEKYLELKSKALRLSQQSKPQVQKDMDAVKQEADLLSQRLGLMSVWR